jgi:integrase
MSALTPPEVSKLLKAGKPVMRGDGDGLYLRIRDSGLAQWVFRYRFNGKDIWLQLGDAAAMSLQKARKESRAKRVMVDTGTDPLAARRTAELEAARRGPFTDEAKAWYRKMIEPKYKHPTRVWAAIENHVLEKLGKKPIQSITAADCDAVLDALREDMPTVANDVLRYLKGVFSYARRRNKIPFSPVADYTAAADAGGRESARDRFLTGDELVTLFKAMRMTDALGGTNAIAIKLILALCVRKGELLAAKWSEFDLDGTTIKGPVWHLPAERTKGGKAIDIPLAPQVVTLLRALQITAGSSEYVFPKRRRDPRARHEHIGFDTLNVALGRIKHGIKPGFTLHDLRRTGRTHMGALGVSVDIAERCLNHKVRGIVGVYDRHDYFSERRQALTAWTRQIERFENGDATVVQLNRSVASQSANTN